MTIICPTVLATDLEDYKQQLHNVSFARRVQVDVMDGIFTDNKSIELSEIPAFDDHEVDLHVMYDRPQDYFNDYLRLRPSMVIVHAESKCDIPLLASKLRAENIKTGVCILQDTKTEQVSYLFPHIQHLLIFSGDLGHYGGSADLNLLQKIAEAKQITKHLEYGWDGGANFDNVNELASGGVDVINVGGAIQKAENPHKAYSNLQDKIA